MNPDTGHLIDRYADRFKDMSDQEARERGYLPVPDEMTWAAARKLLGKSEATVSLGSGGKLAGWAAKVRKNRRRNAIAKQSRKRNR